MSIERYWILIKSVEQPGRGQFFEKVKVLTEGYFYLPTGKFQHGIQMSDWDVVTPEAIWVGSQAQVREVLKILENVVEFEYCVLPIPSCFGEKGSAILRGSSNAVCINLDSDMNKSTTMDANTRSSQQAKPEGGELKITKLGDFLYDATFMRKVLAKKNLKETYINIYYRRDESEPPYPEEVLSYDACFVRFHPSLPKGWRFMCQLSTYVEMFRRRCRNICECFWMTPWSHDMMEVFLNDSILLYETTSELVSDIIFEAELCGNQVDKIVQNFDKKLKL